MTLPTPYYQDESCTIYNADCREILPHLPKVDLVLTDPPYGMNYQSNFRVNQYDLIENDDLWDTQWLGECVVNDNVTSYVFCNERSLDEAKTTFVSNKWGINRLLVWDKGNVTAGDLNNYGLQTEFIIFGTKKSKKVKLNGSRDSNLISIPRLFSTQHPTEKPISLISYLIIKSSKIDDLVLDPFMGSGTTLRAAKDLNRKAIGIEIEEKYCEIAARRLQQEVFQFEEQSS